MTDRPLVFVPQPIDEVAVAALAEHAEVVRGYGPDARDLREVLPDVEVLLVRTEKLPAAALAAAPRLRFVQRVGIGVDGIDLEAATAAGIPVFNTAGGNIHTVAEMTLALALAVARQIPHWDAEVRAGRFATRELNPGTQLHGKTWGVIGLGSIGGEVARLARAALGMRVLAYHPSRAADWVAERGAEPVAEVAELMSRSDVVSLHVPRTASTRGLVGAEQLQAMRPRSILVNMSRGGVVDEAALVDVLRARRIGGAAIDVFEEEPPPPEHPLFSLDNVVLSPHRGGRTVEATELQGAQAVQHVIEMLRAPSIVGAINEAALAAARS